MLSPKVLIVDDHEPFRRFVLSMLAQGPEYQVVGQAVDCAEAIRQAQELQPDLVLLDVGLPGPSGIQVARRISRLPVLPKTLFLSQESSPEVVTEAMRSGAMGYVHKLRANRDLLSAIGAVLKGEIFVSSNLTFSLCVLCATHLTIYHKAKSEWNAIRVQLQAALDLEHDMFQRLLESSRILSAEYHEHRDLYFGHVRGHRLA